MKKNLLLVAIFALGSMTYAQNNQVISKIEGGNATAKVGIEVTGKVFSKADQSLVVEIKSAPSANGTGFAFVMPNVFSETVDVKTARGDFEAYIQENGKKVAFTKDLKIALIDQTGTEQAAGVAVATPAGTATGVSLNYALVGGTGVGTLGKVGYEGAVEVTAKTTAAATAGTYSDSSAKLKVEVTGQAEPITK